MRPARGDGDGAGPARVPPAGRVHTVPMRVAEIAELTGTTVRTVRYYHSLGLLPVPAERGGWRDYELAHVARLSRIRWLVRAGLSLEAVGRILGESDGAASLDPEDGPGGGGALAAQYSQSPQSPQSPRASQPRTGEVPETGEGATRANPVVEDLAGALEAVEEHLDEVTRQRDMLAGLLERARGGATVSPMTPRMAAFFDRMERAAPDGATRATVRNDRDLVDLACYRGQMPPEAEVLFNDPDPQFDAESLALYAQDPAELSDEEVERRARTTVGNLEAQLDPERLRDLARSVDVDAVRSIFRLTAALEYFDIRLARALEREFLATIERWREG